MVLSRTRKPKLIAHGRFHRDHIYCLTLMPNGEFLLLNRDYKPLGLTRSEAGDVDYYAQATLPLSSETVKRVAINDSADSRNPGCHRYWLYDDGSCPAQSKANVRAYKQKLEALSLPFGLKKEGR